MNLNAFDGSGVYEYLKVVKEDRNKPSVRRSLISTDAGSYGNNQQLARATMSSPMAKSVETLGKKKQQKKGEIVITDDMVRQQQFFDPDLVMRLEKERLSRR